MAKKETSNDSWDNESNEVKSNWVKFNVSHEQDPASCDKIFGTFTAKRQIKSNIKDKENELVWVYELKADSGQFHELDEKKKLIEEPIVINAGEVWSIGGKAGIDSQMRNVRIGQKIGFKFMDEMASKTKGFAPAKNIKVYTPPDPSTGEKPWLDREWLDAQSTPDQVYDAM